MADSVWRSDRSPSRDCRARVRAFSLWEGINRADGVLYCDTDSIACRDSGDLHLDPLELGAWDVEAECKRGAIAGKKLYAFELNDGKFKTASKGVRLKAPDIFKIAAGRTVTYSPESPTFSLKRGIRFTDRKIQLTT